MNRILAIFATLLLSATLTTPGQSPQTTKGNIIGTWVKDHTQVEDHGYPADPDWQLEVTFSSDGTFVWQATRTVRGTGSASNLVAQVDESVKGKYEMGAYLITTH